MPLFTSQQSPAGRDIYSVSRLNREVRTLLEGSFPSLWIEGEISNLARPASGHAYFSLKDAQAQIRCAFFRQQQRSSTVLLRDGQHVLVRARVSLYEGRGDYQLIVDSLEDAGEGALKRAFEALKSRLGAEGLFDMARKRALPLLPRRIGVITSASGAAIHDIVTTLRRRFPAIPVLIYPVPVQGEGAAEKIRAAIELAGRRQDCDVLLLARGGGSLEDLWPFNEEIVARAIYRSTLPIVTGIGHEVDFTIADFVADARAPTPTGAAELLSPHAEEWLARYSLIESRLARSMRQLLVSQAQRLDWLAARLIHPAQRLAMLHQRLDILLHRLASAQRIRVHEGRARLSLLAGQLRDVSPRMRLRTLALHAAHLRERLHSTAGHRLKDAGQRLKHAAGRLQTLSPLATLSRGYAIVLDPASGRVVSDARHVRIGETLRTRLAHGEIDCRVEAKRES